MNFSKCIISIACILTVTNAGFALNVFRLGNSLQDQNDGLIQIAQSKGDSLYSPRYTVPGCGLQCLSIWGNPTTISDSLSKVWDGLIVEPFCNGTELGIDNDAKWIKTYWDQSLAKNPNCKLYIFTQWPSNDGT